MRRLKETSLIVVMCLFITILLLYWLRVRFVQQQENMQAVAPHFFLKQ